MLTDIATIAQDKQARLLAEENPGHFSLVRALHLADFITELNGTSAYTALLTAGTPSHTHTHMHAYSRDSKASAA
jgi:hypothetical protein